MLGLVLAGLVGLFVIFRFWQNTKAKKQDELIDQETPEVIEPTTSEDSIIIDSYKVIKEAFNEMGSTDENFARLHCAQAMHESDIFSSVLYVDNCNAFGMRQAKVRDTSSIGTTELHGSYASYKSLADSAKDVLLWDRYNKLTEVYPDITKDSCIAFVRALSSKSYFEAPFLTYQNAVYGHLRRLNALLSQG
jgi:hypothetical protein